MASYPAAGSIRTHRHVKHTETGKTVRRHIIDCRELVATGEWEWVTEAQSNADNAQAAPLVNPNEFARAIIASGTDDALKIIDALDFRDPAANDALAKALEMETAGKARAQVIDALRTGQTLVAEASGLNLPKPPTNSV